MGFVGFKSRILWIFNSILDFEIRGRNDVQSSETIVAATRPCDSETSETDDCHLFSFAFDIGLCPKPTPRSVYHLVSLPYRSFSVCFGKETP